jgi:heat shock protein HtpX
MVKLYSQITKNILKTYFFIGLIVALLLGMGIIINAIYPVSYFGLSLRAIFAIFAIISAITGYYHGDKIVLKAAKARRVTKQEYPHLYNVVEGLSLAAGIPTPAVYVMEDNALNAFATGRNPKHASIAVTTGLLRRLNRTELEGVVAHELSHIKNYDILIATIVSVMAGIIVLISDWIFWSSFYGGNRRDNGILPIIGFVLALLAPFIAMLIQLAISRKREYLADASGALLTRYPEGLASALEKISYNSTPRNASKGTAHMYIANPLKNVSFSNLFSTHPPIEKRIKALREM